VSVARKVWTRKKVLHEPSTRACRQHAPSSATHGCQHERCVTQRGRSAAVAERGHFAAVALDPANRVMATQCAELMTPSPPSHSPAPPPPLLLP
jgi:hypothetical protein